MTLGDHLIITLPDCPTCLEEVCCDGTSYWCEAGCGGTWFLDGTACTFGLTDDVHKE